MALHVAMATSLYSASVLDNATIGCFLILQEIAPLSSEKTKLDVNVDRRWEFKVGFRFVIQSLKSRFKI